MAGLITKTYQLLSVIDSLSYQVIRTAWVSHQECCLSIIDSSVQNGFPDFLPKILKCYEVNVDVDVVVVVCSWLQKIDGRYLAQCGAHS